MTEKRFTVHKTIGMFHCFYLNDDLRDKVVMGNIIHKYEADRLCGVLNALHEENQHLKGALKELKEIGDYQAMRIQELDDENEQLKGMIKEAYDSERTALGKSVLKNLVENLNIK